MLLDNKQERTTVLQFINVQLFTFASLSFESMAVEVFAVLFCQMNSPLCKPSSFVWLERWVVFRFPVWVLVSEFIQLVNSVGEEPLC